MRSLAALLLLGLPLCAQNKVDFTKQIAPILVQRCIECHGPDEQEGDLRLDAKAFVFAEGDEDFWTVAPKDPDDSELLRRLGLGRRHRTGRRLHLGQDSNRGARRSQLGPEPVRHHHHHAGAD